MLRALIVDAQAVLRRGLVELLTDEFPGVQVTEAQTARQALACSCQGEWGLIILDLDLPDRSGLDLLGDVRSCCPRTPLLVLSASAEAEYAKRTLRSGAAGYVHKHAAAEELVAAIRKVLAGGIYIDSGLAEKLASDLADNRKEAPHQRLTNREFQILRLIAAGGHIKEIAIQLSLSPKTISAYRTRVLRKLALRSDADLARYAVRHGLVEP